MSDQTSPRHLVFVADASLPRFCSEEGLEEALAEILKLGNAKKTPRQEPAR